MNLLARVVCLCACVTSMGCGDDAVGGDALGEGVSDTGVADAANETLGGTDISAEVDAVATCPEALANTTRCAADGAIESCIDGAWQRGACPGVTVCDEGACLPIVCTPDAARCDDDATRAVCSALGTRWLSEACVDGSCVGDHCVAGCVVDSRRCDGLTVLACGADHVETPVLTCDGAAGETCAGGRCLTDCERQGAKRGYVACDFWAADLPNDVSAVDNVFAFVFSNASPRVASVTVTYPWGPVEHVSVPVGGLATHALPVPRQFSQIGAPGLSRQGFRIQSDQPIAAFMFNPLERYDTGADATVATNDASILIPAPALGTDYLAVTWSDPAKFSRPPFVTVVATRDATVVTVTPTETILIAQSPFVLAEGVASTFTLAAHETLNLEPIGTANVRTDLTGTRVTADKPVAVFSGNRCARVPDEGRFCDHIETQLPPLETWGASFVVAKFTDRGGEQDYYRVLARDDGTVLTFDPPRAGAPVLAAGQMYQFASRDDFALDASKPILLAHFMASENMTTPPGPFGVSESCPSEIGGTCQGDPALVLAAPVAQWRRDQIFLVPDTYRHQFIDVTFSVGSALVFDDLSVDTSDARVVGGGDWRAITLPASGGFHTLVGDLPVGVIVYGYDHNISYAYNGGLDFRDLGASP